MAPIISSLALLCLCAAAVFGQQQCDKEMQDVAQCFRDQAKPPGQGQGQRPNFEELKTKADQCFTSNGCQAPKFPGGPGGQGGAQGRPQGGRAGRVGGGSDPRQCFDAIESKIKDELQTCVRKTDPTFTVPEKGQGHGGKGGDDHDGPFGGHGGRGGPGGPGGFGGPGGPGGPHGGPGGPGGPGGLGGPGAEKFLLDACNNNAANVQKVNACLAGIFPQRPSGPNPDQFKAEFCKAKTACEGKLSATCKATLEKRAEAMCNCQNELKAKRAQFMQQEPACADFAKQEQSLGKGGPGGEHGHDCSQKPKDPCQ